MGIDNRNAYVLVRELILDHGPTGFSLGVLGELTVGSLVSW
jgi:hypothetical protein